MEYPYGLPNTLKNNLSQGKCFSKMESRLIREDREKYNYRIYAQHGSSQLRSRTQIF